MNELIKMNLRVAIKDIYDIDMTEEEVDKFYNGIFNSPNKQKESKK